MSEQVFFEEIPSPLIPPPREGDRPVSQSQDKVSHLIPSNSEGNPSPTERAAVVGDEGALQMRERVFINPDNSINVEKFQAYLNELPETDEDYQTLMKDIEDSSKEQSYWSINKFAKDQKERFIKVYNAIVNHDLGLAVELMYSFFQEECQGFDENVLLKIKSGLERLTGAKLAGTALYNVLSFVSEHVDDLTGRDENGIGSTQRLLVGFDNIGQGLGDFIFSSEGLFTMGAIAGGEALLAKASSTLAPYVGAAIHSYFGAEGVNMVGEGSYKILTGSTLEEVAEGGQEIGHGLPLMGTAVRAGGALYKGVKAKIKPSPQPSPKGGSDVSAIGSKAGTQKADSKIINEQIRANLKQAGFTEEELTKLNGNLVSGVEIKPENAKAVTEFCIWAKENNADIQYVVSSTNNLYSTITRANLESIKSILSLEKEGYDGYRLQKICTKYLNEWSEEKAELIKDILTTDGMKERFNDYGCCSLIFEQMDGIFNKPDLKIDEIEHIFKIGKEKIKSGGHNIVSILANVRYYIENQELIKYYSEKLNIPLDDIVRKSVFNDINIPKDRELSETELNLFKVGMLVNAKNIEYAKIIEDNYLKLTDREQLEDIGICILNTKTREQAIILNRIIEEYPYLKEDDIEYILSNTKSEADCKAKLAMFDIVNKHFRHNGHLEGLYIPRHIRAVVSNVENMEQVEAKMLISDKLVEFLHKDHCEDVVKNLDNILYTTTSKEIAEARVKFLDSCLKNKIEIVYYHGGDMLRYMQTIEQAEFVDLVYGEKCNNLIHVHGLIYPGYPKNASKETLQLNIEMLKLFTSDKKFYEETRPEVLEIFGNIILTEKPTEKHIEVLKLYQNGEVSANMLPILIDKKSKIDLKQLKTLQHKMGRENVEKLSENDLIVACKMVDVYKVNNLNEITAAGKKNFIRALVECNNGMFEISDEMMQMFPLIPTNVEQYCGLMRATVKSLGIETNPLTPEGVNKFSKSISDLSQSLASLKDEDFASLHITQEFSREDFISTVREKTKDLSQLEKQKVYDYYGFELHHKLGGKYKKDERHQYTLTGYPVNLNNGKKLAEITDPNTKAVVESLRSDVVRFSEQNPIRCENKQVEALLNEVVEAMPEIRSMIGRTQHGNNGTKGAHDFDVMQHSLKVMQKITQNPDFKKLNDSDQRIMLLASLLHDITKAEGVSDHTHASEGGFDTYYICKKLNLTEDEELKLFNLTRLHEWLNFVNKSKSEEQLTKRLQSVAFDMQNGNLFDMALIFTHADLKAVKADDTFHDTRLGNTRAVFDKDGNRVFGVEPSPLIPPPREGNSITPPQPSRVVNAAFVRKSHGETADIYAERIRGYIHELQKTRPLTPTTKVPTMSEIKSRLKVNPDGSTQFKGVFVDKDGLVVIKVNDVEDWEGIGFPKGTTTKGIKANVKNHGEQRHEIETGNFKLMMHGLDYPNQLVKFEKFTLPDTKELLSITYTERPETKSRFFRPQGVGLDFDPEHVHGGGETDAGSGCGKTVDDFKKDYIFGGEREGDRVFTANIVKKVTGMSDEEYIKFYDENKNKSWQDIEPPELADKLIKAYAEEIKSTVRGARRAYTEYYGSKVKRVNSTWVYSVDYNEKINNPLEFLNRTELTDGEQHARKIGYEDVKPVSERTSFLREFSHEHDIPMLIFGE